MWLKKLRVRDTLMTIRKHMKTRRGTSVHLAVLLLKPDVRNRRRSKEPKVRNVILRRICNVSFRSKPHL